MVRRFSKLASLVPSPSALLWLLIGFVLPACGDSLEPPAGVKREPPHVELVPTTPLDAVEPVLHVEVDSNEPLAAERSPRLYRGALSSYHLGKIRSHDLPATLLEREVSAVGFFLASRDKWVIAPSVALSLGETYSLASSESGLLAELKVTEQPEMLRIPRIFPPPELARSARYAVYCAPGPDLQAAPGPARPGPAREAGSESQSAASGVGNGAPLLESALEVSLLPSGAAARVSAGAARNLFADRCLRLTSEAPGPPGTLSVPPPELAGLAPDPAPFVEPAPPEVEPELVCTEHERRFGPGCVSVLDDRLIVRSGETRLWVLRSSEVSFLRVLDPGRRAVVLGFPASHRVQVDWITVDLLGRVREAREEVSTLAPMPHVVINEVLANPIGPEPAQEWIELYNDGASAVDLGDFAIEDVGGRSVLPSYLLEPAAFVLVTSAAFDRAASWDAPFPADAVVLQVETLGKSGISNSGEPLRLLSATGSLLSTFPAHVAKAGVSSARREPCALEDDASAFSDHAAPGASPFAPNLLEPPAGDR